MKKVSVDVVIVGTGTSAYYCALPLTAAGKKVALVDNQQFGGTCALRGCQPKKYLVSNAEVIAGAAHLLDKGISGSIHTNWSTLQKCKNAFTDAVPDQVTKEYQSLGIKTFLGQAGLSSPDTVQVGETQLVGKHIVIATGSIPRRSPIPGAAWMKDSEYFLNLPRLPKRILFVGGGYISFEFAHVAARAGAQCTIFHRSKHPLKVFDPDMVGLVLKATEAAGIKVITEEPVVKVETNEEAFRVHGASQKIYDGDLVIDASGRTPNLSILDGDKGKVESSSKGIHVNEYLQSVSNPHVYAIGDVIHSPQLAPVADQEGMVVAENILQGPHKKMDYSCVPSSVFTIPHLASVGYTDKECKAKGVKFRVNKGSTVNWPSSKRIGENHAGYKIIIEEPSEKILGAHSCPASSL